MSDDQTREPFNFLSAAVGDATESLESQLSAYREALVEARTAIISWKHCSDPACENCDDEATAALSKIDSALGTEGK